MRTFACNIRNVNRYQFAQHTSLQVNSTVILDCEEVTGSQRRRRGGGGYSAALLDFTSLPNTNAEGDTILSLYNI